MFEDLTDDILADVSNNGNDVSIEAICQRSCKLNIVKKFIQCFHEDKEKVVMVAVSTKVYWIVFLFFF